MNTSMTDQRSLEHESLLIIIYNKMRTQIPVSWMGSFMNWKLMTHIVPSTNGIRMTFTYKEVPFVYPSDIDGNQFFNWLVNSWIDYEAAEIIEKTAEKCCMDTYSDYCQENWDATLERRPENFIPRATRPVTISLNEASIWAAPSISWTATPYVQYLTSQEYETMKQEGTLVPWQLYAVLN